MKKGLIILVALSLASNSVFAQSSTKFSEMLDQVTIDSKPVAEMTVNELIAANEQKLSKLVALQNYISEQRSQSNTVLLSGAAIILTSTFLRIRAMNYSPKALKLMEKIEVNVNSATFGGMVGYGVGKEALIQFSDSEIEDINEELVAVQTKLLEEQAALLSEQK